MNLVLDTRPSTDLSDSEVQAYLFQLLRSGAVRTREAFLREATGMFPDMPVERLNVCSATLAVRLLDKM